jgi:hypothetical protein
MLQEKEQTLRKVAGADLRYEWSAHKLNRNWSKTAATK